MLRMALLSFVVGLSFLSAVAAPVVSHAVLDLPAGPGNSRNSEGDFAVLKDGRILFAYSKFVAGAGDDHDQCVIAARTSSDRGETWGADRIVVRNEIEPNGNVMSVSFLRLGDGRLAMFYGCKIVTEAERTSRKLMRVSADEGETWGPARDITAGWPPAYRVLNNARAVRLSSGRIVVPLAEHAYRANVLNPCARLVCALSDDDGATWRTSGAVPQGFDAGGRAISHQEPGVVELRNGRVLLYFRTDEGRQWYAYSADGGASWSKPEPSTLWSPLSPATIKRLSSGELVCLWNDHEGRDDLRKAGPNWACGVRTPLTMGFSSDEGRTWTRRQNVEDGYDPTKPTRFWYCYTSLLELDDRLLLAYCAEDNLHHLRIRAVPLPERQGERK